MYVCMYYVYMYVMYVNKIMCILYLKLCTVKEVELCMYVCMYCIYVCR